MERAGTGLIDVGELMQESDGACALYHHEKEARFEARVVQPHPWLDRVLLRGRLSRLGSMFLTPSRLR